VGKYLAAIRRDSDKPATEALQELQEAPSCTFCSTEVATFLGKTNARWSICYSDMPPMEVLFTPPATRAEVGKVYPGAGIEALPEPIRRDATPLEVGELRKLVARVFVDDADRAEALAVALADPDAALPSFRALAS
jgi:hypothetical protein